MTILLEQITISLIKIICVLIAVAYFTIAERKIMAAIQRRRGPNVVGFWGLLQPLADGLKLFIKELLVPTKANPVIFLLAPTLIIALSLISWSVIPFNNSEQIITIDRLQNFDEANRINFSMHKFWHTTVNTSQLANINYTILFVLAISSLNVYGIIIAGWASNSKYAFLGALRSAAQMISYEVSIGLVILPVILLSGSLNFINIVSMQKQTGWFVFPLFPCAIIFFISMLAETNRAPFDLPEAEAELVAGYNVEYSSIIFAMFFLGEYSNMLLISAVISLLYFGGWTLPFVPENLISSEIILATKIGIFCFLFILVRAAFPRYRYDQLMSIGWKIFLPLGLSYLIFIYGIAMLCQLFILNIEVITYNSYG